MGIFDFMKKDTKSAGGDATQSKQKGAIIQPQPGLQSQPQSQSQSQPVSNNTLQQNQQFLGSNAPTNIAQPSAQLSDSFSVQNQTNMALDSNPHSVGEIQNAGQVYNNSGGSEENFDPLEWQAQITGVDSGTYLNSPITNTNSNDSRVEPQAMQGSMLQNSNTVSQNSALPEQTVPASPATSEAERTMRKEDLSSNKDKLGVSNHESSPNLGANIATSPSYYEEYSSGASASTSSTSIQNKLTTEVGPSMEKQTGTTENTYANVNSFQTPATLQSNSVVEPEVVTEGEVVENNSSIASSESYDSLNASTTQDKEAQQTDITKDSDRPTDDNPADDIVFDNEKQTSSKNASVNEGAIDAPPKGNDSIKGSPTSQKSKAPNKKHTKKFDKNWYANDSKGENVDDLQKKAVKFRLLIRPGIIGFNDKTKINIRFIEKLGVFCHSKNRSSRLIFDMHDNTDILPPINKGVSSLKTRLTMVFFSSLSSNKADTNGELRPEPIKNATYFFYSNLNEKNNFFIKESRYFIIFDDSHHSTLTMLALLLELVVIYRSKAKPIFLYGEGWKTKIDNILNTLSLGESVKDYLHLVTSFDELKDKIEALEESMQNEINTIPKIIDRRVFGDEKDLVISQ
jgi:hypothetical protein